jgi:succinyl-CoA synthetase beta subunit
LKIEREFYLGFVIDRKEGRVAVLVAKAGGSEVEGNASAASLLRAIVDPALGPTAHALRDLSRALGLEGSARKSFFDLVGRLYTTFIELDCSLLEVNPLALLSDGSLAIADCKMAFDDSALPRHPELLKLRDIDELPSEEYEASKHGLSYVRLEGGSIGCMVNGAGLAMATLDAISGRGGSSANFLDLGGGADADAARRAFRIILDDSRVDTALVNILGGIVSCDEVAAGIEAAIAESQASMVAAGRKMRIVARLAGNHADEGRSRLMKIALGPGFSLKFASNMEEAASFAVAASEKSERL